MTDTRAENEPDARGLTAAGAARSPESGDPASDGTTLRSPWRPVKDIAPLAADAIAGYALLRALHRGGQGVIYEALQHSTHRRVAIKVLREGPFASREDQVRFEREVAILAQLRHPNIVTIHDSGVAAGCSYFVMDYVPGQPLDQWAAQQGRPTGQILHVFEKICAALQAAHARGIVHRDLKPSNVRVDAEDEPHVLDFGLAKVMAPVPGPLAPADVMTTTGQFTGSLPWAAPEQAEALPGRIDARTDVYALGVILYQLLTRRFPYVVDGALPEVLSNIIRADPVPPRTWRADLDRDLETLILKCLHKERERRYQTAGELTRDLERYRKGEPIAARRDSVPYVLQTRFRRVLGRHPLAACVLLVLAVALLVHTLGAQIVYRWTPMNAFFETWAARSPFTARAPPLTDVRIVRLGDDSSAQVVARAAGLEPGRLQSDPKQLRHAHGRLMERLAQAGPKVVAWDIQFPGESPADADFLRGVEELRRVGCDVLIAANTWSVDADFFRVANSGIVAATKWGCTPAGLGPREPWRIYLAVQRDLREPLSSLALRAFASCRQPGADVDVHLSPEDEQVTLAYWQPAQGAPGAKLDVGPADAMRVSGVRPAERDDPPFGLRRGDMIAYYLLHLPSTEALADATLEYARVLDARPEELRRLVGGRAVVVGDARGGARTYDAPDGRRLWGTYAHAIAIDMLLRAAPVHFAPARPSLAVTMLAAALGVFVSWHTRDRGTRRRVYFLVLVILFTGACLGVAWRWQTFYNPLLAIVALVLAGEAAVGLRRVTRPRHT